MNLVRNYVETTGNKFLKGIARLKVIKYRYLNVS